MHEPKSLTQIFLMGNSKTTTEKEGSISLIKTRDTLNQHKRDLVNKDGRVTGEATFFTHCGELYNFIMERINEGRKEITIRTAGQTGDIYQFVWRDGEGKDHTHMVNKCCIHGLKKVHSSQRMYEPIPASTSLPASVVA